MNMRRCVLSVAGITNNANFLALLHIFFVGYTPGFQVSIHGYHTSFIVPNFDHPSRFCMAVACEYDGAGIVGIDLGSIKVAADI